MAVKFSSDVPVTMYFRFGDFLEINGQFGPQYMYSVDVDGQRDKLYASPALHQQLQEAGMAPEHIFTITKARGEGNRVFWNVQPEGRYEEGENGKAEVEAEAEETAEVKAPAADRLPAPASGSAPEPPSRNGRPATEGPDFPCLQRLMEDCLQASWRAWNGLDEGAQFSGEDVRAVAITLFLECARKGVLPQLAAQGLPF